MYKRDPKLKSLPPKPMTNPMADPRLRQMLSTPTRTAGVTGTAQRLAPATPPPSRLPQGMNPNFKPAMLTSGPKYSGPGFGPSAPPNLTKLAEVKNMVSGRPTSPTPQPRSVPTRMPAPMSTSEPRPLPPTAPGPKPMKHGGSVSASKRADGIAQRGKTKGTMC
jgi:hypothetical protein